ncbi:MAG: hypothetical protein FWG39_00515 [Alphaproteobacteria bacterium]|nr:hypothetical protein [Alphaproteobacteria bacterium]
MLEQRGSNLLETLLAIGLVSAMAPFVYNRVAEVSRDIKDVAMARQIAGWKYPVSGFIRSSQMNWEEDKLVELDAKELQEIAGKEIKGAIAMTPAFAFIEKFRHLGGVTVEAYLLFPGKFDGIRMHKIARHLGADAAVAGPENTAFSVGGGWSIETEMMQENDLVYRIPVELPRDDSFNFMHRVDAGDERLNTMERNLMMARNNVTNAGAVGAGLLDSKMVSGWFAAIESFAADEAVFPDGANMDGSNASFDGVRVMGDVVGFRNIQADLFEGGGGAGNWSAQGDIIASRAQIMESVRVGRTMTVKSATSRTVSGFTGISAYNLTVPFVSADEMRFADGLGLVVSNELSSSYSDAPLKLGNWMLTSQSAAPGFSSLTVSNAGNMEFNVPAEKFGEIMKEGWKDSESIEQR